MVEIPSGNGHDTWIYQGRQAHGWFGHGTAPGGLAPDLGEAQTGNVVAQRIRDIGHTLVAGLPASKRYHPGVRLDDDERARLSRLLTAVVQALPLGLSTIARRIFGKDPDTPGIDDFVQAAGLLRNGQDGADLREATDALGKAAQDIGLDHFKSFLQQADAHLTQTGEMFVLVRDIAPAPERLGSLSPVSITPSIPPRLPPPGLLVPLISRVLRGAGWFGMAAAIIGLLARSNQETQIRAAVERFGLDPANPADMAAAVAYQWASVNRSLLLGTTLPGSAQEALAEQVMWAARSDPSLLDRAMSGDTNALATIRAAVKATPNPGIAYEVRSAEERALVVQLTSEGKDGAEIQRALDDLRASGRQATAKERRNTPGVVVMSKSLPYAYGLWLAGSLKNGNGALIPGQVAEKLLGRRFLTFDDFRDAFWKAVVDCHDLAQQFNEQNRNLMRRGYAPYAADGEGAFELHHSPEIGKGGPVYDLSTITVVTSRQHAIIHYGKK